MKKIPNTLLTRNRNTIDRAKPACDFLHHVKRHLYGHGARIVESLLNDFQPGKLRRLHDLVDRHIRERDAKPGHFLLLDNARIGDGETRGFPVSGGQPRCAKLDASEITDNHDSNVGNAETVDLAQNRLSGSARRLSVVVELPPGTVGTQHICPTYMARVVILVLQ